MAVNIWGTVGGTAGFLPLSALTGLTGQLLGMNAAATLAEWKAATFLSNQMAVPAGSAAIPSYTFTGGLTDGFYKDAANTLGFATAGVRRLQIGTAISLFATDVQVVGKLVKEDFSADIVAAATTDLATATGNFARITNAAGATNISNFGGDTIPAGTCFELAIVIAGGSVTLVYDANKIDISTGINTTLQNGDIIRLRKTNDASPFYKLVGFQRGLSTTGIAAKGDLIVGTVSGGSIVPGILPIGVTGQIPAVDLSQNSGLIYIDNPARPDFLTNSNWLIDQVNEGGLYTVNATDIRGPDGWSGDAVGGGVFKLRTVVDPDNIALKALEITCTTADAAIVAADRYEIWTAVEGSNLISLQFGTASAQQLLYQFKLKSPQITGVFGVYFSNSAGNRFYAGTITVPDANEHEYTVALTGDLAGTWLYTNGIGLRMGLVLAAGANFQGAAGAWNGVATVRTTAAQANFMSSITNVMYLKRGHLIPGNLVQAYRPADIQKELARAQRQFCKTFNQGVPVAVNAGTVGAIISDYAYSNGAGVVGTWDFPVVMRTNPTIATIAVDAASAINWTGNTNRLILSAGDRRANIQGDTNTLVGINYAIHATATARLS